jgi:hypothetical protein
MKTNTLKTRNIKGILISSILLAGIFCTELAQAQRPPKGYSFSNYNRGANTFVLGLEGGISTRTFVVKSDIDAINQLQVVQEGWSMGLIIGGKNMTTRLVFGNYNTSSTVSKEVGQKSFGGQMSVYPLSLLGVKSKYFQPYIITGIEINAISFSGNYIPAPKLPLNANQQQCQCACDDGGSGLPGDPDMPSAGQGSSGPPSNPNQETQPDPDLEQTAKPRVDKLLATQALAGLGLEISFKSNDRFYTMFSEARYGIPVGVEALTAPLRDTSISGQLALYFGVRIGLTK